MFLQEQPADWAETTACSHTAMDVPCQLGFPVFVNGKYSSFQEVCMQLSVKLK